MNSRYNNIITRISHHRTPWRDTLLYIIYHLSFIISLPIVLSSCAIKDDIPYPIVETEITVFEVEGMCDEQGEDDGTAIIDKSDRTIEVYVNDMVDITNLKVTNLEVTNDATVIIDSIIRRKSDTFPTNGLPVIQRANQFYIDCSEELPITLRTWQDYEWTVYVTQVINREVEVEGQVGDAVVDANTHTAVLYVSKNTDLARIKVHKLNLGGTHGTVTPDPTQKEFIDFTMSQTYEVRNAWNLAASTTWKVYVYQTDEKVEPTISSSTSNKGASIISGMRPNGVVPVVEYRAENDADWTTVSASDVKYPTSTTYQVELKDLHSFIKYLYRVTFDGKTLEGEPFYFEGEQLENSNFDEWHIEGEGRNALYLPWDTGNKCYWDTGNHGATTVGSSNSTYVDEDGRRYANLQSRYIVIKFAAGNIFTGEYLDTDGTDGILSFGRPFTSRPVQMELEFQYKTSTINRTGGDWKEAWGKYITRSLYERLKGQPDSCSVYIALGDWEPERYEGTLCPYLIRTRASELHLMDFKNSHLIGYAQMTCGDNVTTWTKRTLDIRYLNDRTPTTVIVVASSSKYGDYFTGGEESLLKIDNIQLIY